MIIDQLIAIKIKSDTVFLSIKVLIDISWYFMHKLFLIINKSQLILSLWQKLLKIFYNNYRKSINTVTRFNLKKSFLNLLIFIDRKYLIIKQ